MDTNFVYAFILCIIIVNLSSPISIRIGLFFVTVLLVSGFIYKHKDILLEYVKNPGTSKPVITVQQQKVVDEKSIVSQLDKFKTYNTTAYDNGIKYHTILKKKMTKLQGGNDTFYGNDLSDLHFYLNLCINNFQEISLQLPLTNYKQAFEEGKYVENKLSEELHTIVNQLYEFNIKQINDFYRTYRDSKNVNHFSTYKFPGPQANNDKNQYELY